MPLTMLKFLASFTGELSVLAVVFLTAALVHVLAPFKRHKIRRLSMVAVAQLAPLGLAGIAGSLGFLTVSRVARNISLALFGMFELWFKVPLIKGPLEAALGF